MKMFHTSASFPLWWDDRRPLLACFMVCKASHENVPHECPLHDTAPSSTPPHPQMASTHPSAPCDEISDQIDSTFPFLPSPYFQMAPTRSGALAQISSTPSLRWSLSALWGKFDPSQYSPPPPILRRMTTTSSLCYGSIGSDKFSIW